MSSGEGEGNGKGTGAEIDRLAGIAAEVNVVDAVHTLQGEFIQFFARETAAYFAAAGPDASDAGLAEHIRQRNEEMQRCWRTDLDLLTGAPRP